MKKLIIANTSAFMFDTETCGIDFIDSSRSAVNRIYRVSEDCELNVKIGNFIKEFNVKKGDIVVTFYEDVFPNKVVIIDNKEWNENLDAYEKHVHDMTCNSNNISDRDCGESMCPA